VKTATEVSASPGIKTAFGNVSLSIMCGVSKKGKLEKILLLFELSDG